MVNDVYIDASVIGLINDIVESEMIHQRDYSIMFHDKKMSVLTGHISLTTAFQLCSKEAMKTNIADDFEISMDLKDAKAIVALAIGTDKIRFIVKDGEYDVRIGPIRKKIHAIAYREGLQRYPTPPFHAKFTLNASQVAILGRLIKEENAEKDGYNTRFVIMATPSEVQISLEDDDGKGAEVTFYGKMPEIDPNDENAPEITDDFIVPNIQCEEVFISNYILKTIAEMLKCIPKGVDVLFETGSDFPLQMSFETAVGTAKIMTVPRVEED